MAGHSKWAKVKHFKGAIDAKRARIFAKLSRELTVAARLGGGDPEMNPRLRMVLLKARAANMPSDNTDRAIRRGVGGDDAAHYEDLTYEIFGPGGVAILAEISTDNRNRTAAEIRSLLTKNGGSIATAGSVTRLFQRRGQIFIARDTVNEDRLMEVAVEAGADDFRADQEGFEILTDPARLETVVKTLETAGFPSASAEIAFLPLVHATVEDAAHAAAAARLLDLLEDHDDVKAVHANADLPATV
ncbi:MAG: YebC/PmpR family DNA-binding transcriptional regulator [Verrucomicrobiae bacterium]|nr:YebC/PmpR family DNA-binding transcriptional regulator [Verrucomicrobiae bacterium]